MIGFKERVLQIVSQIPKGRVSTYGTIAILAGMPRGGRLVGGILHFAGDKYPWHRVINRHGYISTSCQEHTKQLQRALLQQEKVAVSDEFIVDLKRYGWAGEAK